MMPGEVDYTINTENHEVKEDVKMDWVSLHSISLFIWGEKETWLVLNESLKCSF